MKEIIHASPIDYKTTYKGIVFTDLDGTLIDSSKSLSFKDNETLHLLGEKNYLRVIATGRSLFSLFQTIDHSFPVDYVICSSGAGIWDMKKRCLIRTITMEGDEVAKIIPVFITHSLDFSIHKPIPDNHYFTYYMLNKKNEDMERRITHYSHYAHKGNGIPGNPQNASQVLAITGGNEEWKKLIFTEIAEALPHYTVIRTTSPLDHLSLWIEVFPDIVSKGRTAAWLAAEFGIDKTRTCAIGNDFNDVDLLKWTHAPYVVNNAPDEMKYYFQVVASHNASGFSEAVYNWLELME